MRSRWLERHVVATLMVCAAAAACSSRSPTLGAQADDGGLQNVGDGGDMGDVGDAAITDADSPALLAACQDYVAATCEYLRGCTGGLDYEALCESQSSACPALLFAHGSTVTVASAASCATKLRDGSIACDSNLTPQSRGLPQGVPAACLPPGKRDGGAACAYGVQCSTLTCSAMPGQCGTCASSSVLGGECGDSDVICPANTTCDPFMRHCVASGPGTPCKSGGDCSPGLACLGPTLDPTSGTCQTPPRAGSPCGNANFFQVCDATAYCDGTPGTCKPLPHLGEACDQDYRACVDKGTFCKLSGDAGTGTCAPKAKAGEPCGGSSPNEILCDGTTSYCSAAGSLGTCMPLPTVGHACGVMPGRELLCATGICSAGCDHDRDAGNLDTCVAGPGTLGAPCVADTCSACAPFLACTGGVCAPALLSTCD